MYLWHSTDRTKERIALPGTTKLPRKHVVSFQCAPTGASGTAK